MYIKNYTVYLPYAPNIGGLRGGGLGNIKVTLYSLGLCNNSTGPSSSSSTALAPPPYMYNTFHSNT